MSVVTELSGIFLEECVRGAYPSWHNRTVFAKKFLADLGERPA
jgi:hypothetical protein